MSAPRSREITTPAPHHSVFYRPDALPVAQPTASKHCNKVNIIIAINQSMNQSIFVYCGMTKCRPTTGSKKAIQLVRKSMSIDDKPKN